MMVHAERSSRVNEQMLNIHQKVVKDVPMQISLTYTLLFFSEAEATLTNMSRAQVHICA